MLSSGLRLFFVLLLLFYASSFRPTFSWLARLQTRFRDQLYFYGLKIPRLLFEMSRYRDLQKISRDPSFLKDHSLPLIVHFKALVFSHWWGIFFLAKSPVFGELPTGLEDTLQDFILILSTVSKHWRTLISFLEYSVSCSKSLQS